MTRPADILTDGTLIAVLAAGRASRFGADKLVQSCAGKPLGQWALDAALGTGLPVVWIAGGPPPDFVAVKVIRNARADQGMATSVACAADYARGMGVRRLLVMLADMPLVTTQHLQGLLALPVPAAFDWRGKPGSPALFGADLFAALAGLSGDRGAASVLRDDPAVRLFAVPAEVLRDVDSPDDLVLAEQALSRG
ncbi:MAG: nucleotidyltransferase family protein [Novosphingobium sp.]